MIAVPMRELSGHAVAAAWGRGHARATAAGFGATEVGSVTSARLRAACSGSSLSVVSSGGKSPILVCPGAPSDPSALGVKPSEAQPVGGSGDVFSQDESGASY